MIPSADLARLRLTLGCLLARCERLETRRRSHVGLRMDARRRAWRRRGATR